MLGSPVLAPAKWDRLLIVANRLPVTAKGAPPVFTPSSGGLVTGVTSLKSDIPAAPIWVGWPGPVAEEHIPAARQTLKDMGFNPVFLDEKLTTLYYDGYCNGTLWPMLHSMPMYSRVVDQEWEAYKQVNEKFAQAVLETYTEGDLVWIHDYHLFLLPKLLRDKVPDMPIMFFLHVPFPTVEILKLLPSHVQIIQGLLHADLIGFHTSDYSNAFAGCVTRIEGLPVTLGRIIIRGPTAKSGRVVQLGSFPMGIDYHKYHDLESDPEISVMIKSISSHFGIEKLVFSVSRLDYTKGVPNSLEAIRAFLRAHPEWHRRFCYVLVVVPSRIAVKQYETLKQEIDRLVGEINGEFSTLTWNPVTYLYRNLSFQETVALYAAADVGFITPLRDGLNLCCKEYCAAHAYADGGVLILGNLAGAAAELIDAVQVNPNSTEALVSALLKALTMPKEEIKKRNSALGLVLEKNDIQHWGEGMFKAMREALAFKRTMNVEAISPEVEEQMKEKFRAAQHCLIVLDYDGTLVPFKNNPASCAPDSELIALLKQYGEMPNVSLVLSSGRDRETMANWFADLPLTLVSEHGTYVRVSPKDEWVLQHTPITDSPWKEKVREAMSQTAGVLPGTFVEEKEFGMVYHFRGATESDAAQESIKALKGNLSAMIQGMPLRVIGEKKAFEVCEATVTKGSYISKFIAKHGTPDFEMIIGDDVTDEDMFAAASPGAFTIRVGNQISRAQYTLASFLAVRALLAKLLPL